MHEAACSRWVTRKRLSAGLKGIASEESPIRELTFPFPNRSSISGPKTNVRMPRSR